MQNKDCSKSKWQQYEMEKQALQRLPLTHKEYEQRIKELTERLGI